jgi:dienelactone hydrolase
MEAKFLTPIQLWKDFDPGREALDISYVLSDKPGGNLIKGAYITSENATDGKVRAYVETAVADEDKKKPVIIIIGDIDSNIDRNLLEYAAGCGYYAASVDYSAYPGDTERITRYPESYSCATYSNAVNNLVSAEPCALNSCWFIWAKAVRRLITYLERDPLADTKNIGVIGIRHGAVIMWQVAATDERIKAAVSINGYESLLYSDRLKYMPSIENDLDESRVKWRAAISSEAYARFVNCPVLMVAASNNDKSSFDRIEDIIKLLPEKTRYNLIFLPGLSQEITESAVSSLKKWLNSILKKGAYPDNPSIELITKNNKLSVKVIADSGKKIKEAVINYSFGEINPVYRNWSQIKMNKEEDYFECELDVIDSEIRHFVFANIIYQDNLTMSTQQLSFIPEEFEIIPTLNVKQRIIYDTGKGIDAFVTSVKELVIKDSNPHIEKSAVGINGITTSEGSLITYKIGDLRVFRETDSILQLDALTLTDKEITVVLTSEDNGVYTEYFAPVELKGGEEWSKLSFESQDFKTAELIPLKDWQGLKKLEIRNAGNILFNNIIWV